MSLVERIAGRLNTWFERRRRRRVVASSFELATAEGRLERVLWLLAGEPLPLALGPGRSSLAGAVVLPERLASRHEVAGAFEVAVFRLALTVAARARERTSAAGAPDERLAEEMRAALPLLVEDLAADWPAIRERAHLARLHREALLAGGLAASPAAADLATYGALPVDAPERSDTAETRADAARASTPRGTERRSRLRRMVRRVVLNERDDGANPLAHVFEKVRTAEEHGGGHRSVDGSDELDVHLEALEELDLDRVVRSAVATSSVFRADVHCEAGEDAGEPVAGVEDETLHYDEWDERGRCFLASWCTVHAKPARDPGSDGSIAARLAGLRRRHARTIRCLRAEFSRLLSGCRPRRRQPVGADLDLDAIVDRHGALRATWRGAPALADGRIYLSRKRALEDVATSILIDCSLSSESWIANRRVFDVARDSVALLGEVLRDVGIRVALAGFSSHSRSDCRFHLLKRFEDEWPIAQRRLFALQPDGYTRIGPALRHATELLAATAARRRLLFVLSDCKPTDYDHYEGRRGIGDVRQAVRAARARGIQTIALTIDTRAGAHLPEMFGAHGFRILPDPGALPTALARLHERVLL